MGACVPLCSVAACWLALAGFCWLLVASCLSDQPRFTFLLLVPTGGGALWESLSFFFTVVFFFIFSETFFASRRLPSFSHTLPSIHLPTSAGGAAAPPPFSLGQRQPTIPRTRQAALGPYDRVDHPRPSKSPTLQAGTLQADGPYYGTSGPAHSVWVRRCESACPLERLVSA